MTARAMLIGVIDGPAMGTVLLTSVVLATSTAHDVGDAVRLFYGHLALV